MNTVNPQHPAEENLLERCKEIGLNDQDTALLHDLLGWNNLNGGIPESYRGIEPQLTILRNVGDAEQSDVEVGKSISQLLRQLVGEELMTSVEVDPVTTLQGKLGLARLSAVWIIAQLQIVKKKCPDIYDEINDLIHRPPEKMPNLVVRLTLSKLLRPR